MDFPEKEWYDIHAPLVFCRGWSKTEPEFGRLPAHAEKLLPEKVWQMRRNSSGMYVEFRTDSSSIAVRWDLADDNFGELNFNVCAYSGIDLFCRHNGKWRFTVAASALSRKNSLEILADLAVKERCFRLYFPFRNCLEKISVGVDPGASFEWKKPDASAQIVYYGSSIIHGSCASRAGNGITAILGRAFDLPVVNLGFSGAARLEPGAAELLAEIDAAFYLVDALPNCDTLLVEERLEAFLHILCSKRRNTPVFLLTDADRRGAWMYPEKVREHRQKRTAARRIVAQLRRKYPALQLIDMARSMGSDAEGTVDGIHPDELGIARFSGFLIRSLRNRLQSIAESGKQDH